MAVDFKTLLSKPMDTVEKPKPLPAGTYNGSVQKYEFMESKEKKTPYARMHMSVHSAGADVDPDSLAGVDLSKKTLRKDFYLTDDAAYRLKDFIESCGVQTAGRTIGETIPELLNAQVLIDVTQRPSEDGSDIFNDVRSVRGVA